MAIQGSKTPAAISPSDAAAAQEAHELAVKLADAFGSPTILVTYDENGNAVWTVVGGPRPVQLNN